MTREELEASLSALCTQVEHAGEGILGPRSLVWRLGGDLAVFIGGGRAALLQLAHPMVAHAIDHHSRTRTDVVGRFQRTFRNIFAMVFGELDDALAAARRVHAIHSRVHGTFAEAIGGWPAGTTYHANDADALRWVHATLADTTITMRERIDGPLPIAIKDRYTVELNRFAALFGIPHALLPTSWTDHARYMAMMFASDRLAVTPAAREMGQFLFGRQAHEADGSTGPRSAAKFFGQPPLGRVAEAVSAELLPRHLSEAFELRSSRALVRVGLAAFGSIYRRLPRGAVKLPAHAVALDRFVGRGPSRLTAWTERQLFGLANRVAG